MWNALGSCERHGRKHLRRCRGAAPPSRAVPGAGEPHAQHPPPPPRSDRGVPRLCHARGPVGARGIRQLDESDLHWERRGRVRDGPHRLRSRRARADVAPLGARRRIRVCGLDHHGDRLRSLRSVRQGLGVRDAGDGNRLLEPRRARGPLVRHVQRRAHGRYGGRPRLPAHSDARRGSVAVSWQNGFGAVSMGFSCASSEPGSPFAIGHCPPVSFPFYAGTTIDEVVDLDIPIVLGLPFEYSVNVFVDATTGHTYGDLIPFTGQSEIHVATLPFAGAVVLDASRQPIPGAPISLGESGFDYRSVPDASAVGRRARLGRRPRAPRVPSTPSSRTASRAVAAGGLARRNGNARPGEAPDRVIEARIMRSVGGRAVEERGVDGPPPAPLMPSAASAGVAERPRSDLPETQLFSPMTRSGRRRPESGFGGLRAAAARMRRRSPIAAGEAAGARGRGAGVVEPSGIEPPTSALRTRRSPS